MTFLSDWGQTPRQFRERFLDQEGLSAIDVEELDSLNAADYAAFLHRWQMVGALPSLAQNASLVAISPSPEPYDLDMSSEMILGMYRE